MLENYELGEFEIMFDEYIRVVFDVGFLFNMQKWLRLISVRVVRLLVSRDYMMLERGRNVDWVEGEYLGLGY